MNITVTDRDHAAIRRRLAQELADACLEAVVLQRTVLEQEQEIARLRELVQAAEPQAPAEPAPEPTKMRAQERARR
jgi:hypothetical protein